MNAKQITNVIRRVYKRLYKSDIFGPKIAHPELRQEIEKELNVFLSKESKNVSYQCVSDLVEALLEYGAEPSSIKEILEAHKVPLTPELEAAVNDDVENDDCSNDPIWDEVYAMNGKED